MPQVHTKISNADKKKICEYAQKNPTAKRKEIIAACFPGTIQTLTVTAISGILKKKEKYLSMAIDNIPRFRERHVKNPMLEEATIKWFRNMEAAHLPVSDAILQQKAKNIRDLLNISEEEFDASAGWLDKFKQRHNIKMYITHGEAASAPLGTLAQERQSLQVILKNYELKNIYNADETGLFYRMLPNQTLASAPVSGKKKDKTRISLLLCTNADGSDIIKPLVIGKSAKPRALKNLNYNHLPVTYTFSNKAWMNSTIMKNFVKDLDAHVEGRKIILLLDNAPSHPPADSFNTRNITIHYLPPNTTAHLQPMDAGIIRTFKAYFKKIFIQHIIQQYDIDSTNDASKLNIKQTIDFIAEAMDQVTPITIRNCWERTGILPLDDDNGDLNQAEQTIDDMEQELCTDLDALINQLDIPNPISAKEYLINPEESVTEELIFDEQQIILELEAKTEEELISEEEQEPEPEPLVTHSDALKALQTSLLYLQQQNNTFVEPIHLKTLQNLLRNVNNQNILSRKQSSLDDYLKFD